MCGFFFMHCLSSFYQLDFARVCQILIWIVTIVVGLAA